MKVIFYHFGSCLHYEMELKCYHLLNWKKSFFQLIEIIITIYILHFYNEL